MSNNAEHCRGMVKNFKLVYNRCGCTCENCTRVRDEWLAALPLIEVAPTAELHNGPLTVEVQDAAVGPFTYAEARGWTLCHYNDAFVFMSRPGSLARIISIDRQTGRVESMPF